MKCLVKLLHDRETKKNTPCMMKHNHLCFLFRAPSNEKGEIAYAEFLKIINWRDCPVPPMQQPVQSDDEGQGIKAKSAVSAISYSALVDAIFGTFHK